MKIGGVVVRGSRVFSDVGVASGLLWAIVISCSSSFGDGGGRLT